MEIKIELAKSWFVLAQIIATIAGFLMVASGIFWSYTVNVISTSINAIGGIGNMTGPISDMLGTISSAVNLGTWFLMVAVVLAFLAIVFWIIGYGKIKNLKN
jgi:uncharacterized membrane protein